MGADIGSVAIRFEPKDCVNWRLLGGVFRRNPRSMAGKLTLVGCTLKDDETVEAALRRSWQEAAGLKIGLPLGWDSPICQLQQGGTVHAVVILGTAPPVIEWYEEDLCPPLHQWTHAEERELFLKVLERVRSMRPTFLNYVKLKAACA